MVAAQPLFKNAPVLFVFAGCTEGHLMRPPRTFHLVPIHLSGAGPAFGRPQYDHRPPRPYLLTVVASTILQLLDLPQTHIEGSGEILVHLCWVVAFNIIWGEIGRASCRERGEVSWVGVG